MVHKQLQQDLAFLYTILKFSMIAALLQALYCLSNGSPQDEKLIIS